MVVDEWMPNRRRMHWAKQLLGWTPTPDHAYDAAMTMNGHYFLWGRDIAG